MKQKDIGEGEHPSYFFWRIKAHDLKVPTLVFLRNTESPVKEFMPTYSMLMGEILDPEEGILWGRVMFNERYVTATLIQSDELYGGQEDLDTDWEFELRPLEEVTGSWG